MFSRNASGWKGGIGVAVRLQRVTLSETLNTRPNRRTIDRRTMKRLVYLLSLLLILTPATRSFAAGQKTANDAAKVEKAKKNVAKLGVGSKARATITLNDGSKVK